MKYDQPLTKKYLGQHWLNDESALDAMVAAAGVGPADTVLEIGPGPGALTKKLVATAHQVVAVEFDPALARDLPMRVPAANLQVINQDILQFDLSVLPPSYKVCANIPYYLTSNVLRRLCEAPNHFAQAALLVQKEVAERVCAKPGDMSLLSVSAQLYAHVSLGELVPAYLFTPPPKVDSQILQLTYRDAPLFPGVDTKIFFRLVRAGFSQKRKMLRSSLASGLSLDKQETEALLLRAHIPPSTRAQMLSLDQWHQLYVAFTTL